MLPGTVAERLACFLKRSLLSKRAGGLAVHAVHAAFAGCCRLTTFDPPLSLSFQSLSYLVSPLSVLYSLMGERWQHAPDCTFVNMAES